MDPRVPMTGLVKNGSQILNDTFEFQDEVETAGGNHTTISLPPKEELSFFFEFFLPGVMLNGVGTLGLVGNLISIFILSRPQMKGSTNCILIGLASYDIILILSSILMFGLPSIYAYTRTYLSFYYWEIFPYITPIVYPIGLIAQTSSAYLTLCVTIERYVAVCRPLKARALCTYGRARAYVVFLGVCAILYNIPRFFEVSWRTVYDAEAGVNRTEVIPTWLRRNPTYISVYITWLYLVVMYIVPFSCLAVFNLRIYLQIRKANVERAQLSRVQQREIRLATMLMIVVLVFFVCNVLALIINILELMAIQISELTQISNLLVTLNSSVNFIIYCIFGEKFKRLFCHLFCRHCGADDGENFQILHRYTNSNLTAKDRRNHYHNQMRFSNSKDNLGEEPSFEVSILQNGTQMDPFASRRSSFIPNAGSQSPPTFHAQGVHAKWNIAHLDHSPKRYRSFWSQSQTRERTNNLRVPNNHPSKSDKSRKRSTWDSNHFTHASSSCCCEGGNWILSRSTNTNSNRTDTTQLTNLTASNSSPTATMTSTGLSSSKDSKVEIAARLSSGSKSLGDQVTVVKVEISAAMSKSN